MAKVLALYRPLGGAVTIDLLNGTLKAVLDTWRTDYPGDGTVVETMELIADDTDANIIAAVTAIDEACEAVVQYWSDRLRDYAWYLKETATSETSKLAMIFEMYLRPIAKLSASPLLGATPTTAHYSLTIIRQAYWMDDTAIRLSPLGTTTLSTLGGYSPIAAIPGNVPGMIQYVYIGKSGTSTGLNQFWMGIKPNYNDTPTTFRPKWELEDGTAGTDAAIGTSVACSGSGSNYVVVSFDTTATMAERVGMTIDQATASADHHDFRGRFMVLCRCAVDSGVTVGLQMRTGYDGSDSTLYQQHEEVYITNTSYKLIPLGEIEIPPINMRSTLAGAGYYSNYEIQLWAELLVDPGASDNLYLDCLILIPSDHYAYGGGAGVRITNTNRGVLVTGEDGSQWAMNMAGTTAYKTNMDYVFRNWTIPIDGGVFVVAAEQAGSQVVADNIVFSEFNYYPRHRTHREA